MKLGRNNAVITKLVGRSNVIIKFFLDFNATMKLMSMWVTTFSSRSLSDHSLESERDFAIIMIHGRCCCLMYVQIFFSSV